MPIPVKCTGCQASFSVKDELAGKRVACPKCKTALVIPNAPPAAAKPTGTAAAPQGLKPTAKIPVKCQACGAAMQVDASLAGKSGKCPKCGQPIKIPVPSSTPPLRTGTAAAAVQPPAAARPTPPPARPIPPRPAPAARRAAVVDDAATPSGEVRFKKTGTLQRVIRGLAGSGLKLNWGRFVVRGGLVLILLVAGVVGYGQLGRITESVRGLLGQVEIPKIESPFADEPPAGDTAASDAAPAPAPAVDPAVQAIIDQHGAEKVATLSITDQVGGQSITAYQAAIRPLADTPPGAVHLSGGGDRWTATLAPVADLEGLKAKITFAEVEGIEPDSRTLTLRVTKALPVPGGAPSPPAETPADPIAQALADLQSGDPQRQLAATRALEGLMPDDRQREVAAALEPVLTSGASLALREGAAKALKVWADDDSVPALVDALEDTEKTVRDLVMQIFVRLKDPRSTEPVAKLILESVDRVNASSCLREMGTISERATIGYLQNDSPEVRLCAVRILQQVGARQSLPPLNRIAQRDPEPYVRSAATEALSFINTRVGAGGRRGR